MRKSILVFAALVVALSTEAFAGKIKSAGPVQMTDEEMDRVVAGMFLEVTANGNTNRLVFQGDALALEGAQGPGANTIGTTKTGNHIDAVGGRNVIGTGGGGGALTVTPGGTHLNCSPSLSSICQ